MTLESFWNGKRVFITGHTGFKGAWLSLWLRSMGAHVTGFALAPPSNPSLFNLANVAQSMVSVLGDIRDEAALTSAMEVAEPEIVIHMAAQSLVRESYLQPVDTFSVNVMGTVHVLNAVRKIRSVKSVVNVTTDKVYENKEWVWGYREYEPLGGYDPYSSSKACSELVASSYRSSFFPPNRYSEHGVAIATARAGNVIGGGDWAMDRLIPDCLRSLARHENIVIRNPNAVRPWQHVLEPLSGYLLLAQKLYEFGPEYAESWNFGPDDDDVKPVSWIVDRMCQLWGPEAGYVVDTGPHPHEAQWLKLDCSKAKSNLGWSPRWRLEQAIARVVEWDRLYRQGQDVHAICLQQITDYQSCHER